jgi:hypothetical protein
MRQDSGNWYGSHYIADLVSYDSLSDGGAAEVWCSSIEPTGDDAETGTWAQSTGTTNFGVITPWDAATYTENSAPTTGDKFTTTCPTVTTHLGITPTVHGVVSHQAISGGAAFKALLDVGAGDVVGATITADVNEPTPAYATGGGGIAGSTVIKIGIKIP